MTTIDWSARITIALPSEDADRFHFGGTVIAGSSVRTLPAEALPTLVPELQPFVGLHNADAFGIPHYIVANAWYFAAGVAMPDLPDADKSGTESCIDRYAKLMRIDREYSAYHLTRLARMAQEFPDEKIIRNEVALLIEDAKPRWQREADAAMLVLPAILERLEA